MILLASLCTDMLHTSLTSLMHMTSFLWNSVKKKKAEKKGKES